MDFSLVSLLHRTPLVRLLRLPLPRPRLLDGLLAGMSLFRLRLLLRLLLRLPLQRPLDLRLVGRPRVDFRFLRLLLRLLLLLRLHLQRPLDLRLVCRLPRAIPLLHPQFIMASRAIVLV